VLQRVTFSSFNRLMTKRNGQPNKNHVARDAADKRRRYVMELRDHSGLKFKQIAKIIGCTTTRASQLYYGGHWRFEKRWRHEEEAARRWKSIASEMVTELDLREAFYRELNHDRAIRNAAMPKPQTKPFDILTVGTV
jgi:hypothetical protein